LDKWCVLGMCVILIFILKVPPPAEVEDAEVVEPVMMAVPVTPVRQPVLWTAWVFFKAFFASLIPEAPQGIAN